jgi:Ser/Thr protein kinase RdoA (MazF antagonist)
MPERFVHWRADRYWRRAEEVLMPDPAVADLLHRLWKELEYGPPPPSGVCHADFGAQNFHVDAAGHITTFDFANCCRQPLAADLVVPLGQFRGLPERESARAREAFLMGYRSIRPLPQGFEHHEGHFVTLRAIYVLVSRLVHFGAEPNPSQTRRLGALRQRCVDLGARMVVAERDARCS